MTHIVPRIGLSILRSLTLFAWVLFGSAMPRGLRAQTPDSLATSVIDSLAPPPIETKANPFSGFETHYLSNGLKVWFK